MSTMPHRVRYGTGMTISVKSDSLPVAPQAG
jgi:hypothetical protein